MWLVWEKCSTKNLWKDKLVKAEFAQSVKNFSVNALTKLSDKSHYQNQKEVFFYLE